MASRGFFLQLRKYCKRLISVGVTTCMRVDGSEDDFEGYVHVDEEEYSRERDEYEEGEG